MNALGLQIDPAQVLGVGRDASLQEIRDAYRAKAKRYHPDFGGEDWAFRILVQAYEAMSTARVFRAANREAEAPPGPPYRPPRGAWGYTGAGGPRPYERARAQTPGASVRQGGSDSATDPARVVDVETLSMYHQPDPIWLISGYGSQDRFLSCSLNLTWPAPDLPTPPAEVAGRDRILRDLEAVFGEVAAATKANDARATAVEGRLSGWLSYPNVGQAEQALRLFRDALNRAGLAVNQRTRVLVV
jgi:curved DNA-binding protein CbpA